MNVQITSKNWNLPEFERDVLERRIGRITKKLPHMPADLVHLVVRVDKHPNREEYICTARLTLMSETLAVRGTYCDTARNAIAEAFDDVERRLDKFMDTLKARV